MAPTQSTQGTLSTHVPAELRARIAGAHRFWDTGGRDLDVLSAHIGGYDCETVLLAAGSLGYDARALIDFYSAVALACQA